MSENADLLLLQLAREKERLLETGQIKKQKSKISVSDSDNPPFSIPGNWCWARLGDVSVIQEGPGIRKHQYRDEGVQFLTVTNILEDSVDLAKSVKHISNEEFESKYSHFQLDKGDIVVACSGGSWGKSAVFEDDSQIILNTSTLRLRFYGDLSDNRYLYYLTKTSFFKNQIASHSTGQQPNFGFSHYSIAFIPLPPLPEQKRIVAILDEAFGAIDRAKEIATQNVASARELFESYLNRVFTEKGDGWEETSLGDVVTLQGGSQPPKATFIKEQKEGYIRLIQIRDYKSDKHIVFIPEEKAKRFCDEDDIMIGRYGPPLFQILRGIRGSYNVALMKAIPDENRLTKNFLYYFLKNRNIFNYIERSSSRTAGQTGFKKEVLEAYPIAFPVSFDGQAEIVNQLEALKDTSQRLASLTESKFKALDELKQSILQKAFTGRLTEKAPELEAVG